MSDVQLLTFGCAITFLAVAGAYVAIREQFVHGFFDSVLARRRTSRQRVETAGIKTAEEGAPS